MAAVQVKRMFFLGGGIKDISFDTVRVERHKASVEVTRNPVETGVKLADHSFENPDEVDIEASVGNVWLHARDKDGNLVGGDLFESSFSRSATGWLVLKGLKSTREPFGVQTGLEFYPAMMLEDLDAEQDKNTNDILRVHMHLVAVEFAVSKTVSYPPRKAGKTHRQASKSKTAGEKATTPVTDAERAKTILRTLDPLALFNQIVSGG